MSDDLDFELPDIAAPRCRRRSSQRGNAAEFNVLAASEGRDPWSKQSETERLTVTLERFGDGWKAWIGDGTDPRLFGLSAVSVGSASALPWHALWRLANDMRVAAERGNMTMERIRACHGVESGD